MIRKILFVLCWAVAFYNLFETNASMGRCLEYKAQIDATKEWFRNNEVAYD
jgi:hypothetical protein